MTLENETATLSSSLVCALSAQNEEEEKRYLISYSEIALSSPVSGALGSIFRTINFPPKTSNAKAMEYFEALQELTSHKLYSPRPRCLRQNKNVSSPVIKKTATVFLFVFFNSRSVSDYVTKNYL